MASLNSLTMSGLGYTPSEFGGRGGGEDFGSAISNAIDAVHKYKLEKAKADKITQQMAWEQNPNNPENQLRAAQAKAAMAQAEGRGAISMRDLFAAAGYNPPANFKAGGVMIPSSDAPAFLEKLAALKGSQANRGALGAGNQMAGADAENAFLPTDLNAKDIDDVKRIHQAMNNLKQVAQQYSSTGMESTGQGIAGMLAHLPGGESFIGQRLDPKLALYNQAVHEAKNAYARGAFGRVNNDLINSSLALFPQAGAPKDLAQGQLNELSNTMKGVADSIVQEKIAAGRPDQAQALKQHFDNFWGNMRFFPEQDVGKVPTAPGPGTIQTNFLGQPQAGAGAQTPQAPSGDQFAKHRALAQTIMTDPEATTEDKAWAAKFVQPAQAPVAAQAPASAPAAPTSLAAAQ